MSKNFREDLIEISKVTGISMDILNELTEEKVLEILMSYNTGDLSDVYRVANMQIYFNVLKKVSEFTELPYTELINLPQSKIEKLVGQYSMEFDITPEEQLKNSLLEVINEKGEKYNE